MDSKQLEVQEEFSGLFDQIKANVSASKVNSIVKLTVKYLKYPATIVDSILDFMVTTQPDFRLSGIYVVDAIAKAISKQSTQEAESFLEALEDKLSLLFRAAVAASPKDQEKMKKVLAIWRKSSSFKETTIDSIEKMWFSSITIPESSSDSQISNPKDPRLKTSSITPPANNLSDNISDINPLIATLTSLVSLQQQNPTSENLTAIYSILPFITQSSQLSTQDMGVVQQLKLLLSSGALNPPQPKPIMSTIQSALNTTNPILNFDYDEEDGKSLKSNTPSGQYHSIQLNPEFSIYNSNIPFNSANNSFNYQQNDQSSFHSNRHSNNRDPTQDPGPYCKPAYKDPSLPSNAIKILSRTLYVGGVSSAITLEKLRKLFETMGRVETIQLNYNKFNAFVKMFTREEALKARENLSPAFIDGVIPIKVGWGCGFGPKDAFDFHGGESTLPITRFSDQEKKWMSTTKRGGGPLEGGTVMEEPDVTIGPKVDTAFGNPQPIDASGGFRPRGRGGPIQNWGREPPQFPMGRGNTNQFNSSSDNNQYQTQNQGINQYPSQGRGYGIPNSMKQPQSYNSMPARQQSPGYEMPDPYDSQIEKPPGYEPVDQTPLSPPFRSNTETSERIHPWNQDRMQRQDEESLANNVYSENIKKLPQIIQTPTAINPQPIQSYPQLQTSSQPIQSYPQLQTSSQPIQTPHQQMQMDDQQMEYWKKMMQSYTMDPMSYYGNYYNYPQNQQPKERRAENDDNENGFKRSRQD